MRKSFMVAIAALSVTALVPAIPAVAQEAGVIGPVVGEAAPGISALMPDGNMASVEGLTGENGVALVFVRSADWCPFCKKQLKELKAAEGPLAERGWTLAALSYDSAETLAGFAAKEEIGYPLLSDEGSATITAFGLFNAEMEPDTRYYGIPHPAIVFVRADGTVAAVLREEGYRKRPPVDVVVATADALNSGS